MILCMFLQMYVGEKKPVVLVDGWDVHFFSDLKNLVSEIILIE